MANETIYPYGTGGQMPTSIGVINDLVTGGADKALSAEMGKQLGLKSVSPISFTKRTYSVSSNGSTGYTRVPCMLQAGITYKVKATLASATTSHTNIAGYTSKYNALTPTGETTFATVPAGATTVETTYTRGSSANDFLSIGGYAPGGSKNYSVEITPIRVGGEQMDIIGNGRDLSTSFDSAADYWCHTDATPVKAGMVLRAYFRGAASIVAWKATDDVAYDDSGSTMLLAGTTDTEAFEKFITIENDGYIICRSRDKEYPNDKGTFTLYSNMMFLPTEDKPANSEIVVAANNTTAAKKKSADYVCSGTNDEQILNAVIAQAITDRKKVKLLEGDYYLDTASMSYYNEGNSTISNAAYVLISPGTTGVVIEGESPINRAKINLSVAAYEALDNTKQMSMFAVVGGRNNTDVWNGYIEINNVLFKLPYNQKKVVALDMMAFGGYARLHSVSATAYTNGYEYNGEPLNITISNPPAVAVDGCIGIRFVGLGPNGSYGNEMTDCTVSGFNEGICINTEWALLNHVISIFCVTGWVFGKYSVNNITSTRVHPIVLICCGDERGVNLPRFERCHDNWQIEMIAFTIERKAANTPGGVLGSLATEATSYKGKFRGNISYTVANTQGTANVVNMGFWEYGHGHGIRTTDAAQTQAGDTALRATFRPNYMQHYYDTDLNKEVICVDEENKVWKDSAGNVVSNS